MSLAGILWSAGLGSAIPGLLPGQEVGELRLENAEFVAPRVAQDPEVKTAFGLVIPAGGAEGLQPGDFGFTLSVSRSRCMRSLPAFPSPVFCRRIRISESGRRSRR